MIPGTSGNSNFCPPDFCSNVLCSTPVEFRNFKTSSRSFRAGIKSSGKFLGSLHSGHSLLTFSSLIKESLAHSSHMVHAHSGMMTASFSKSLQTGHLKCSGIFKSTESLVKGASSLSQNGRSTLVSVYAFFSISFTI